jgi:hypothetical protein
VKVVGLTNLGNTCFFNSALQVSDVLLIVTIAAVDSTENRVLSTIALHSTCLPVACLVYLLPVISMRQQEVTSTCTAPCRTSGHIKPHGMCCRCSSPAPLCSRRSLAAAQMHAAGVPWALPCSKLSCTPTVSICTARPERLTGVFVSGPYVFRKPRHAAEPQQSWTDCSCVRAAHLPSPIPAQPHSSRPRLRSQHLRCQRKFHHACSDTTGNWNSDQLVCSHSPHAAPASPHLLPLTRRPPDSARPAIQPFSPAGGRVQARHPVQRQAAA